MPQCGSLNRNNLPRVHVRHHGGRMTTFAVCVVLRRTCTRPVLHLQDADPPACACGDFTCGSVCLKLLGAALTRIGMGVVCVISWVCGTVSGSSLCTSAPECCTGRMHCKLETCTRAWFGDGNLQCFCMSTWNHHECLFQALFTA